MGTSEDLPVSIQFLVPVVFVQIGVQHGQSASSYNAQGSSELSIFNIIQSSSQFDLAIGVRAGDFSDYIEKHAVQWLALNTTVRTAYTGSSCRELGLA